MRMNTVSGIRTSYEDNFALGNQISELRTPLNLYKIDNKTLTLNKSENINSISFIYIFLTRTFKRIFNSKFNLTGFWGFGVL